MTQMIIRIKLSNYLDLVQSELTQSLKETSSIDHDQKIKALDAEFQLLRSQLMEGHCFGFAVLHGAFDTIYKNKWWESALLTIANWNEIITPLDALIELPDSEENTFWQTKEEKENAEHIPTNKKAIKLRILLERVLAYLIHHQQCNSPLNNNQTTFLSPANTYFELINNEGNVLSIQKKEVLAGYLNQAELEELLNVNDFSDFTGIIGLIHNNDHTIRIGFKENKWLVYDPNYDHRTSESMQKYFDNKTDLANEIIRILGHSLAIQVNSFDPNKHILLSQFTLSKPNEAINRIRNNGIHLIARHCPNTLKTALELARLAPNAPELIAEALALQDIGGWTGLHMIARHCPNTLKIALDLAADAPKGPKLIAEVLAIQNMDGWSGLHLITGYCPPDTLEKALDLAGRAENGPGFIAEALATQDKDNWSGLHMIAEYCPNTLETALDLAGLADNGSRLIAEALATNDKDNWTGLHMIARYCSQNTLEKALDLAGHADNGSGLIAQALANHDSEGWSGLDIIACFSPNTLEKALDLAARAPNGSKRIAELLATQNKDGWNGLHMIASHCPSKTLEKALDLAAHADDNSAPKGHGLIVEALATQNKDGWSSLQIIALNCPNTLKKALDLAAHAAPEGFELIAKALAAQSNDYWSGLHVIARYCPNNTLEKALDLAMLDPKGSELIAQALVTQNMDGISGADIIAQFAQKTLLKVFGYTIRSLLEVYPQEYFHLIYKYAPSLLDVNLHTVLVQSNNKELLATALGSKKDDLSGFDILIQTKQLPSQLIEILKFTAPNTSLDTSNLSQEDAPKLSYANFIEVIERYMAPKHQPNFFPLNDPEISPVNANWLLKLNAATSDVHRYELAQDLMTQHPSEPLAELLLEAITFPITQHAINI